MLFGMKHLAIQLLLSSGMVQTTRKSIKRSGSARRARAAGSRNARLTAANKKARAEYNALVRYLKSAVGVLPKAECQLLLEFAEIAKRKCARLHRSMRTCSRPATA